jgi:hypothetical protein
LTFQHGIFASRPWEFEIIRISTLVEQEKEMGKLKGKMRGMKKRKGRCSF